ncbi:MAG: amidohydrolase family protein [Sulfurospirillum sp.]|nr:amidohydrolase family protein [Sulfurospirillum sp.]
MKLIKNAIIFENNQEVRRDLLIKDGKIEKIAQSIDAQNGCEVIDAVGNFLLAGVIDLNVRLANSQLNESSLEKLSASALNGGVSTAVIMPDFTPSLDSSIQLEHFKIKADMQDANLLVAAPLSGENQEKLNNIATLLNNGACAIFSTSACASNLLKRGMQYALMKDKPFFCSCYDPSLDDNGVMHEGIISAKLGLSGISKLSQNTEVAKITQMASAFGVSVVFQKLSTKRSLDIIKACDKQDSKMYKEVSIHHLIKNDSACNGFNTYAKIMPPLRDEEERLGLLEALCNGDIDLLTAAHAPKSIVYKDVAFEDAAFGLGAIEEYLALAYTFLVKKGYIDMFTLMELMSKNPAKILGLQNKGTVAEGFDADLVIFDPKVMQKVSEISSLYAGETLYGAITKVFVGGEMVKS